jgi:signal transduction histidine kinase
MPMPGADHDLRTPLTTILIGSRILRRVGKARHDPELQEVASAIEADAERLRDVVEDVLIATRSSGEPLALNPEPLLLERMVSQALGDQRHPLQMVEFNVHAMGREASVLADETCLAHVLRDLVATAARQAPSGSKLDVTIGSGRLTITPTAEPSGAGKGVAQPADDSHHWRIDVCRDLVEAMGGHLRLGDDPGSPLIALELPLAVGD